MVAIENSCFDDTAIYFFAKNVDIYPVWKYSDNKDYPKNQLIFGYSHLTEAQIEKAVTLIKDYVPTKSIE